MMPPFHHRDVMKAALPVAISLLLVLILWISPIPAGIKGWANYLPLHMALETASIFFAGMIFAITWHTPRAQTSLRTITVGCIFAGVALLDFSHMLSYPGMPDFISHNTTDKAIYFWFAARILAGLGLLTVALRSSQQPTSKRPAYLVLAATLIAVAALHLLILSHPERLPLVFIEGQGLTPRKIHIEYALVVLYLIPAVWLMLRKHQSAEKHVSGIITAALLMAMSEFMLTLYADVTDLYNLSGHVLKVAAYFYLYQPLFVESLQLPYERLGSALAELKATLQALPDLLFELDEDGRFLAVHTSRSDLLVLPPDEFIGKTMQEVLPSTTANVGLEAIQEAKAFGVSHGKLYELELPVGKLYFELSAAPKPQTPTEKARYIFIARDVTQRVNSENVLRKKAQLNAALLSLPQQAASTPIAASLQKALRSSVELADSTLGFMALLGSGEGTLNTVTLFVADHEPPLTLKEAWPLKDTDIWSKAIAERRPVVFNQPSDLPAVPGLPAELGTVQRWIALPIFDGKNLVMLAGIGNKATPYVDNDVEYLHLLSYSVWQTVHKHQTDNDLVRFSLATSQSPNPVVITDVDARIEYVNEAFTKITGYSAAEVMGKNPSLLQSGKTPLATYRDMWSRLVAGQAWTGELINRRKNGQEYHEEALIYPIRNEDGVVTHYLAHKQDISDRKSAADRIQYLSEFDQLTGLPNRTQLMEQLRYELAQTKLAEQSLAVLWINLDLFKDINDTFGHGIGDAVLREVAHRMRVMAQGRDIVARYSGDNFILARTNIDQLGAMRLVNQLFSALARPIAVQDQEMILTASIGVALYPMDGATATDLMRCAETAMYRVKHDSRNSYSFYSPDMQARTARALQLTNALKLAFMRDEFRVVYQPQISLRDGRMTGAEALLRWRHPQLGDISPAEFIPLAENAGLGAQVGEWVLQHVLADLREWQTQSLHLFKVAVNLSAGQFSEPSLVEKIQGHLEQSGISPRWLELELTEIAAMKHPAQAMRTMSDLSGLGLSLSIDDFGTGYSSLSLLKRFRVYKLKIDQSFVRNVVRSPEDQAIVTAIINMAHSLGMVTLAEGVETEEQLAFLKANQCDEMQGYLYRRPLEKDDFAQLLRSPPPLPLPA